MKDQLKRALGEAKAEYAEIRLQEGSTSNVVYSGPDLESIGESTILGGCVHAFVNGGWGFVSFNDPADLPRYVRMACEQAAMVGGRQFSLAPVKPASGQFANSVESDPIPVPFDEKEALCRGYNEIILRSPKIQTTVVGYRDSRSLTTFVNTDGAVIEQEVTFCGIRIVAIAKDGTNVQAAHENVGDLRGYQVVTGLEHLCEKVAATAADQLTAPKVEGGVYTVVTDPLLCGVFAHEAFGHMSEADFIYENESLREVMRLGRRLGSDFLSIVDDATIPGEAGSYGFDSEGTPGQKTYLMKDGILTNRLHSRETAAKMDEPPTGSARAISYDFQPIVRMSNTYIEPRDSTFEQMVNEIDSGIYVKGALGGQTNMEMFTFSGAEAFEIKGGKVGRRLRDVVLTGNLFETLANIDAIGNDLTFHGGLGGCGKGGQSPLRVGVGGPHVRIRNVVIGGAAGG